MNNAASTVDERGMTCSRHETSGLVRTPLAGAVTAHTSSAYWDWLSAYDSDRAATAWSHPDYVLNEAGETLVSPQAQLITLRTTEPETERPAVACAVLLPKTISSRKAGAMGPAVKLHGVRLAGGQFIQPQPSFEQTQQLLAGCLSAVRQGGADFLLIEDLDIATDLYRAATQARAAGFDVSIPHGLQPRRRILFPERPADYWSKFSGKTLSTLRRKRKKCGSIELRCYQQPAEVGDFLAAAHTISLETWQTRQFGLRVRNSAEELTRFTTLAQLGLFRSYLWLIDGTPVAFLLGDCSHGRFVYQEVGYRTSHAKFSPGQLMLVDVLEDLIRSNTPHWFDFGQGDADYKQQFANQESQSGTVWLLPRTLRGRALGTWMTSSRSARSVARLAIRKLGLLTRLRQWVRYGGQKTTATESTLEQNSSEAT